METTYSIHELVERNRRNSRLLLAVFFVLVVALGVTFGSVWGRWWLGAIVAGALAFFVTLLATREGDNLMLGISHAHEIDHTQAPQLFNVVEELCLACGMPMPRIYLIDDSAMNAFATGRDPKHSSVAITL